jgi:hypothetical protein
LMWGNWSVIRVVCLDISRDKLWILKQMHCYIFLSCFTLFFLLLSALFVAPYALTLLTGVVITGKPVQVFQGGWHWSMFWGKSVHFMNEVWVHGCCK